VANIGFSDGNGACYRDGNKIPPTQGAMISEVEEEHRLKAVYLLATSAVSPLHQITADGVADEGLGLRHRPCVPAGKAGGGTVGG
jgi:hypothetical protein